MRRSDYGVELGLGILLTILTTLWSTYRKAMEEAMDRLHIYKSARKMPPLIPSASGGDRILAMDPPVQFPTSLCREIRIKRANYCTPSLQQSAPKVPHPPRLYAWTSDKTPPITLGPCSDTRVRVIVSACAGLFGADLRRAESKQFCSSPSLRSTLHKLRKVVMYRSGHYKPAPT